MVHRVGRRRPVEGLRPGRLRIRAICQRSRGLHQPRTGRQRLRFPGQLQQGGICQQRGKFCTCTRSPDGSSSWETMEKIKGLFPETNVIGKTSGHREPDGWLWPGDRNLASVSVFVDYLEQDLDPPGSGDNGLKVLEIAIGLPRVSQERARASPVPPRRQEPSHDSSRITHELQEAAGRPRGIHATDGQSGAGRSREGVAAALPRPNYKLPYDPSTGSG